MIIAIITLCVCTIGRNFLLLFKFQFWSLQFGSSRATFCQLVLILTIARGTTFGGKGDPECTESRVTPRTESALFRL